MSTYTPLSFPQTTQDLLDRAIALTGKQLSDFNFEHAYPLSNTHMKGRVGQWIEQLLGITNNGRPEPDFQRLGIELKTLPMDRDGTVHETTYLCHAPISPATLIWEDSLVYQKVRCILWIPIIGPLRSPLLSRVIGHPLLWHLPSSIENILKSDWIEFNLMMLHGHHDMLTAKIGQYLQLRPKAPNAATRVTVTLADGQPVSIVPKGYYLRKTLTELIVKAHYLK